jgi:hypothetical protein
MLRKGLDEFRKLSCRWRYGCRLSAYLDHELSPSAAEATASHLCVCAFCQATLEQLLFANKALGEFQIPLMRSPLIGGNVLRLPQPRHVSFLKRLYSRKIAVPVPLAAVLVVGMSVVTGLALVWNQRASTQSANQVPSPPVVIKRVEVPVDRLVTRTVYLRQPASRRVQISPAKNRAPSISTDSNKSIAQNNRGAAEWSDNELKDFRPATNANFRVIKEHEK